MAWILVPALVGAVALYIWNALVWMVLPHHKSDFLQVPSRANVEAGLRGLPPGGFYMLPHMNDYEGGCKNPELKKRTDAGPNAMLIVGKPGMGMKPATFVIGFVIDLVEACALACVLRYTTVSGGFGSQLGIAATLGGLVHGVGPVASANWMGFPWPYALKCIFDGAVGWALMAVALHFVG
jgi:hypothetical protein